MQSNHSYCLSTLTNALCFFLKEGFSFSDQKPRWLTKVGKKPLSPEKLAKSRVGTDVEASSLSQEFPISRGMTE